MTDIITMRLTNGPITVSAAGAVIDLRDQVSDLGRITCGTNATCTVGGPGSNEVTITLTATHGDRGSSLAMPRLIRRS